MPAITGLITSLTICAISAAPEGDLAPDFELRDTYGQTVSVKGYRGSVMWITFGATW
jgi:hypothetical protein